jgi:hypothetical protein
LERMPGYRPRVERRMLTRLVLLADEKVDPEDDGESNSRPMYAVAEPRRLKEQ